MTAEKAREITYTQKERKLKIMSEIYDAIKLAAEDGKNIVKYRGEPICSLDYNILTPQTKEVIDELENNGFKAKLYGICGSFAVDVYILIEW